MGIDHVNNSITKGKNDRPKSTVKYKDILSVFETAYETDVGETEEGGEEEEKNEGRTEKIGSGIQFIPGNIMGLLDRLKLLHAERKAGSISATANEMS